MRVAVVLVFLGTVLSSCEKIIDHYTRDESRNAASCRIASYTYDYYGSMVIATFDYDVDGKPISITHHDEWLPDGQAKEVFVYDEFGRLTHHIPDEYIGSIRHYIYEGNAHMPVRDTIADAAGNKYVEEFTYDKAGRIVRIDIRQVVAVDGSGDDPHVFKPEAYRYYYDAYGNRQANPYDRPWHRTIRYSDKPSLYSLHPTWQLVFRDFSRNNASKVATYNEYGLPITFIYSELDYWQPFFDLSQNAVITYECD